MTHGYFCDLCGNRLKLDFGSRQAPGVRREMVCTYDALNRMSTLSEGGRTTQFDYDLSGNVVQKTIPGGEVVKSRYDGLNRLCDASAVKPLPGGELYHFVSIMDAVGNLCYSGEYAAGVPSRTLVLQYDQADRLKEERVLDEGNHTGSLVTYAYDAAGNRTSRAAAGTLGAQYTYNELNQLTSLSDPHLGAVSYTYDLNGNRTKRTAGGRDTTYGYDLENRLVSVGQNRAEGVLNCAYRYDYRSRRVRRTENGATTQVVFSGGTSAQEYVDDGPVPSVEYLRGSDWGGGVGGLLYTLRGGTPSYAHYNHRGDVTTRTDSTGTITWQASYEAGGTRTAEYGTTPERQKANTKEEDPTGLLNEGMRYRDLETDTFLTRDPAGFVDGPNLYSYVRQNPWSKFDPEGLEGYALSYPQAMWDPKVRSLQNSPQYQAGYQAGMRQGAIAGTAIAVGVAVTIATDGAAAPYVAKLGLDATTAGVVTAGVSGAAGGVASNTTANVLNGKPAFQNTGTAALTGAALGMGGQVLADSAAAFNAARTALAAAPEGSAAVTAAQSADAAEAAAPAVPTEAYNRKLHYGRTPTAADRKAVGAGEGEVADHEPPLVKRYYEGDPATGEKPGYQMTPEERRASSGDRSRMSPQPRDESNAQGGEMSKYSKEKKEEHGLQ